MSKKADNTHGAIAAKKNKSSKLNVLVFDPEGGAPYTVEVHQEDGLFNLPGRDLTYKISRGSVWIEGGASRTCVNADNPQTINIHTLTGSDVFHPITLNGVAENNLVKQVVASAKTKPVWARASTWGILGMGLLMGLLLFWLVKTLGTGLEDLQQAIENIKITVQNTGSGGSSGNSTQHNRIAPGGV